MIEQLKNQVEDLKQAYRALLRASIFQFIPREPDRLNERDKLRIWIEIHMPELDRELGPMSLDAVRIRLNEITGCDVQGADSVENGSAVFLEALKKMKEAS